MVGIRNSSEMLERPTERALDELALPSDPSTVTVRNPAVRTCAYLCFGGSLATGFGEQSPAVFTDVGERQLKNIADPVHVVALPPNA
jgi:hypothetical protein